MGYKTYRQTIRIDAQEYYDIQMDVDIKQMTCNNEEVHLIIDYDGFRHVYTIKGDTDEYVYIKESIYEKCQKYVDSVRDLLKNMIYMYRVNAIEEILKKYRINFSEIELYTCTISEHTGCAVEYTIQFKDCDENRLTLNLLMEIVTEVFGCKPNFYFIEGTRFEFGFWRT